MTDEPEGPHEFKGRIFDGKVSMLAWSIAARLQPDREAREERMGLAIAAQIGLNHDMKVPDPNSILRRKLAAIQAVLDDP